MTAAEISDGERRSPSRSLVEKFGLRGKHIAAPDEHVSDLAVRGRRAAARRARRRPGRRSTSSSTSARRGRTTPSGRRRRGSRTGSAARTRSRSSTTTSRTGRRWRCGSAANLLVAEPELRRVLAVGASRESYLLDYANERSRFMFNFGDGAVGGAARQRTRPQRGARLARDHGRLALAAGQGAVGRQRRARRTDGDGRHFLDVADPAAMKERLDEVEPAELRRASPRGRSRGRARRSPTSRYVCGIHMKRSMHDALLDRARRRRSRARRISTTPGT